MFGSHFLSQLEVDTVSRNYPGTDGNWYHYVYSFGLGEGYIFRDARSTDVGDEGFVSLPIRGSDVATTGVIVLSTPEKLTLDDGKVKISMNHMVVDGNYDHLVAAVLQIRNNGSTMNPPIKVTCQFGVPR